MNVRVWNYTSWLYKKKVVKSIGVHYQPFVYKKMPRKVWLGVYFIFHVHAKNMAI